MFLRAVWAVLLAGVIGCGGTQSYGEGGGDDAHLPMLEKLQAQTTRELSSDEAELAEENGFVIMPSAKVPSFHFGYSALFEAAGGQHLSFAPACTGPRCP